jgi:crotonobetainyl-CoA:carnitine CoA-transferase CaiB-like acyl-CoA transferase
MPDSRDNPIDAEHPSAPASRPVGERTAPLAGMLVADFSRVLAGPYLTMLLADLGATVIKVESPEGDQTRKWGPPWHEGVSTYYTGLNRGKRSVVLDLAKPDDRRLATVLASRADLLVENMLPGRMKAFGLDYESVRAANDRLVYCSLTGFGSQAGGAELPGFDLVAQAAGGLMSITGEPDGSPTKVGVAVVDVLCGLHAAVGVLAAIAARERTGRGQLVEANLLLSALSALANQSAGYLATGAVPGRLGNVHPSVAPYEVFDVDDGQVVIAAGTDGQFISLCKALGLETMAVDPRFATNSARVANQPELREILLVSLAGRTIRDVIGLLREFGVPAGPVNDIGAAFELASALNLNALWQVGGSPEVRTPFLLSETPPSPGAPAPSLDRHGEEIRRWLTSALLVRAIAQGR